MLQSEMDTPEVSVKPKNKLDIHNSRIRAFDFARGIAIIAMVVIHIIRFLVDPDLDLETWGYIVNMVICLVAAPVFAFIMGIMIGLSSKNSSKQLFYRGLILLGMGYVLNFFRGTIPVTISRWFEWSYSSWDGENPLNYLLEMDILQFAGLAFIIIALLKRLIPSNVGLAVTGVLVIFISPLLFEISSQNQVANYVLSMFFGGSTNIFFPVVSWIAFPLVGIYYGAVLKTSENKKKFFTSSLYVGLILIIVGIVAVFQNDGNILDDWIDGEYWQGLLPPAVAIIFIGFQGVWLSICYYISEKIKENWMTKTIYFWSKNVTVFYIGQWILLGWLTETLPFLSLSGVILTAIVILIVTDRVCHFWINTKKNLTA